MGSYLRATRLNAQLTQKKLAKAVDISTNQLQNIEHGRSSPNVNTAIKIAEVLGMSEGSPFASFKALFPARSTK